MTDMLNIRHMWQFVHTIQGRKGTVLTLDGPQRALMRTGPTPCDCSDGGRRVAVDAGGDLGCKVVIGTGSWNLARFSMTRATLTNKAIFKCWENSHF